MTAHKIAVIPGDGIGNEVVPQGLRVLEIAASRFGIDLAFDHFDFASCGRNWSSDSLEKGSVYESLEHG